jgi:signal transduction histidine kinase
MLHKEMIQMQSAFRGFLLTSDEGFLTEYYDGISAIPRIVTEERILVEDIQKMRLDSILLLHGQWVEYADSMILLKKDTLPAAMEKYQRLFTHKLKTEVGKKFNDRIKKLFVPFDSYDYKIRQMRREQLESSIRETREITSALTIFSILLAVMSSIYFIRSVSERIRKMVNLAEEVSNGHFVAIEQQQNDEFLRLVEALNRMSMTLSKNFRQLQKQNLELDQFAYVVSHDLKAPMRGIANIIAWMEEDHGTELTPNIRKNLALIKGRATRLENMINGLLEYAKTGKVKKGIQQIDVNELVSDICELLVPDKFDFRIRNHLPVVQSEKLLLEQIFTNLISNAVKYNQNPNPFIEISSTEFGKYFEFRVRDNGKGIEEEYFNKIFVIFQTLQERDAFESTGVGLAIVKKILDDHRGSIRVESEVGSGTTFIFTWPKNYAEQES